MDAELDADDAHDAMHEGCGDNEIDRHVSLYSDLWCVCVCVQSGSY